METHMEMRDLFVEGNLVDNGWLENLKYDSGKPNLNAVLILSEIVYWYRPTEIRDENTGLVKGYKKKFKADKLQMSYEALSNRFGLTKRQVKDACDFLKEKGVITVEFRTVRTQLGSIPNVMYIEPVIAKLKSITGINRTVIEESPIHEDVSSIKSNDNIDNVPYPTFKRNTPYDKSEDPQHSNVTPLSPECGTNTKNTSKTTTKNSLSIYPEDQMADMRIENTDGKIDKDIDDLSGLFYNLDLKDEHKGFSDMIQASLTMIYYNPLIAEKLLHIPFEVVKAKISQIDKETIMYALDKYLEAQRNGTLIEKPHMYFAKCIWTAIIDCKLEKAQELLYEQENLEKTIALRDEIICSMKDKVLQPELIDPIVNLAKKMTEISFNSWFKSLTVISKVNNVLQIVVPSNFIKEQLENKYMHLLVNIFSNIGVTKIDITAGDETVVNKE